MIVCKACATRNADSAEFCTSCGRYLAWSGEHVDDEVAPEAPLPVEEVTEPEPVERDRWMRRALVSVHLAKPGEHPAPEMVPPSGGPGPGSNAVPGVAPRPDGAAAAPADGGAAPEAIDVPFALTGSTAVSSGPPADGVAAAAPDDGATGGLATATEVPVSAVVGGGADGSAPVDATDDVPVMAGVGVVAPRRPGDVTAPPGAPREPPSAKPGEPERPRAATALRRPTEAVTPARSRRNQVVPAVVVPTVPLVPSPGDVYCPRCNQFNPPARVFCRRCGEDLHAPVADNATLDYVPLSWWQRHAGADVRVVDAGGRPGRWGKAVSGGGGQGRASRIASRALMGLAAVGFVLTFLGPTAQPIRDWISRSYESVLHKVNITYSQQFAIGANATSQVPAHPAADAVDDASTTWWQTANVVVPKAAKVAKGVKTAKGKPAPKPKAPVPGVGQRLTVVFAEPTTINRIGILSGAAGSPQAFLGEARPREVLLTFTGTRKGYEVHEHLRDTQSFQQFSVDALKTTSMTMTVLSVYPSPTGKAMAVTEIEFYQRQ